MIFINTEDFRKPARCPLFYQLPEYDGEFAGSESYEFHDPALECLMIIHKARKFWGIYEADFRLREEITFAVPYESMGYGEKFYNPQCLKAARAIFVRGADIGASARISDYGGRVRFHEEYLKNLPKCARVYTRKVYCEIPSWRALAILAIYQAYEAFFGGFSYEGSLDSAYGKKCLDEAKILLLEAERLQKNTAIHQAEMAQTETSESKATLQALKTKSSFIEKIIEERLTGGKGTNKALFLKYIGRLQSKGVVFRLEEKLSPIWPKNIKPSQLKKEVMNELQNEIGSSFETKVKGIRRELDKLKTEYPPVCFEKVGPSHYSS